MFELSIVLGSLGATTPGDIADTLEMLALRVREIVITQTSDRGAIVNPNGDVVGTWRYTP